VGTSRTLPLLLRWNSGAPHGGGRDVQFRRRSRKALVAGAGLEGAQGVQMDGRLHCAKDFLSMMSSLSRLWQPANEARISA
jgi:hypothetical protein